MQEFFTTITFWLSKHAKASIVFSTVVLFVAFIAYLISGKIIRSTLKRLLKKLNHNGKPGVAYYIFKNAHLPLLSLFCFVIGLYVISQKSTKLENLLSRIALLILIAIITKVFSGIVEGLIRYTENDERFHGKPYRSFAQVVMILVYIAVAIIVICILTEQSPTALLTGFGAITAVISLMFRETILSFVSSIQISAYDLVRTGDWIELTNADIDGEVVEISLHTIKVKNWDNSLSSYPTNALLSGGFKNWRTMQDMQARRIKRSIRIDADTVKFVDEKLAERLKKLAVLKEYFASIAGEYDFSSDMNKAHITNLEVFKVYAQKYIENISEVRKDMTLLLRTYEVSEYGVMLEVYGFSSNTAMVACEGILGKTLQDFLATLSYFDLRPFQLSLKNA